MGLKKLNVALTLDTRLTRTREITMLRTFFGNAPELDPVSKQLLSKTKLIITENCKTTEDEK